MNPKVWTLSINVVLSDLSFCGWLKEKVSNEICDFCIAPLTFFYINVSYPKHPFYRFSAALP
jgi:hypothetical protein